MLGSGITNLKRELIMHNAKSLQIEYLSRDNIEDITTLFAAFEEKELASLFVDTAVISTAVDHIKDQFWLLNNKGGGGSYRELIQILFENDLKSLIHLKEYFSKVSVEKMKSIYKKAQHLEDEIVGYIFGLDAEVKKEILMSSLVLMTALFLDEEKSQFDAGHVEGHQGLQLYRTFDKLDVIFDLDYKLDRNMKKNFFQKERLYQGGGVGVQSGYSTILLALDFIKPSQGQTMIDLGSGYGRVGLVSSLLYPDTKFIGYEFVEHRVDDSNRASQNLVLEDSLNFYTQDLSLEGFKLPVADIYYLYDPFTKETYTYILKQLVEISKSQKITIVTKGNAKSWLKELAAENGWPDLAELDEGNLCICYSI